MTDECGANRVRKSNALKINDLAHFQPFRGAKLKSRSRFFNASLAESGKIFCANCFRRAADKVGRLVWRHGELFYFRRRFGFQNLLWKNSDLPLQSLIFGRCKSGFPNFFWRLTLKLEIIIKN